MANRKKRLIYGGAALLLFLAEVLILLLDRCFDSRAVEFVRFTVGDLLVVMLIYAVLRVIFPDRPRAHWLALGVFAFAVCVEVSQYLNLIGLLGLGDAALAHLTIGSTFDWHDIGAYAVGSAASWGLDTLYGIRRR